MSVNQVKPFFDQLFGKADNQPSSHYNGGEQEGLIYFDTLLKEFYSTKNMRLKSDIKRNQVFLLSVATIYRDVYHSQTMGKFIEYLLEHNVSIDRKGRTEFREIFNFITNGTAEGVNYDSALASMLGLGRRL